MSNSIVTGVGSEGLPGLVIVASHRAVSNDVSRSADASHTSAHAPRSSIGDGRVRCAKVVAFAATTGVFVVHELRFGHRTACRASICST